MSTRVVRVGGTVRRPAEPHTPAVHALLSYLHSVGFEGAPRPMGLQADTEYIRARETSWATALLA